MILDSLPTLHDAAPIIISLIIIEGLLSVDNMLAIAALASQLPEKQKKTALRLGLAGAYVFRIVALFFAGFIMENEWVKFVGAFYLIHLMADHFSSYAAEHDDDPTAKVKKIHTFWPTVISIQLMDLSLSVDNVVAAVAMSPDIRVVCLGVFLGLLTLWMFASVSLKLVEKFPILQHTAFLLIGYVGVILLTEMTAGYFFHAHLHITAAQKFVGIVAIMGLSLLYDRSEGVRKACDPLFKIAMVPIGVYAKIAGGLIAMLLWPFKAVFRLVSAKS
jgi:YkoY family integral membrane protein